MIFHSFDIIRAARNATDGRGDAFRERCRDDAILLCPYTPCRRSDAGRDVRRWTRSMSPEGLYRVEGCDVSVADHSMREQRIANASAIVSRCRKCAIGETRRNAVYGEGDPAAGLMVIGEGPGETEDRIGRPFIGRAGELLDKMLAAIRLAREDVFICNTVKCRPTLIDGDKLRNRAPDPIEMANCRPYLDEQIDIVRPRIILALGAPAAKSFLGPKFAITRQRGQWFEAPNGTPLIATFHPAYILRMTGGELNAVKRLVYEDLKAVRERLDRPPETLSRSEQTTFL